MVERPQFEYKISPQISANTGWTGVTFRVLDPRRFAEMLTLRVRGRYEYVAR